MRPMDTRLSWSKSRAETFEHCLRKYWWNYYGARGGFTAPDGSEAREAWVLKNLHSRWTWAGHAVHGAIEKILRRRMAARDTEALAFGFEANDDADPAVEAAALTAAMREQWRHSRDKRYHEDPKRYTGLIEHEYGVPVSDAEWKATNRRAVEALQGFLQGPVWQRLRESDPSTWLPIETLDSFDVDGVPVWVALDFALRTPEGAEVFDWKTGEERVGENRMQLVGYALYLNERHGIAPDRVTCHLVYLNAGKVHDWTPGPSDREDALARIRGSVAQMRARLRDPAVNEADRMAFPMTDDLSKCTLCAFRRLCGR